MAFRLLSRVPMKNAQFLIRASFLQRSFSEIFDFNHSVSSTSKRLPNELGLFKRFFHGETVFQRFGFSSSPSTKANEKETNQSENQNDSFVNTHEIPQKTSETDVVSELSEANDDSTAPEQPNGAGFRSKSAHVESQSDKNRRRRSTKRAIFSDSDTEPAEFSVEELVKLVAEKDISMKAKQSEIEKMQDKVLRTYAEMENVLERTKREVENSKKFGIQNFAKGLLDVADNLGRASSAVKENFSKIDQSIDSLGLNLLKSLLEGVEMTEKQLAEVFKKSGIHKYDPLNEKFDPNRHNAVFELPDESKPAGTIAAVLKPGYMIFDRVLRPAEVGVTKSVAGENQS